MNKVKNLGDGCFLIEDIGSGLNRFARIERRSDIITCSLIGLEIDIEKRTEPFILDTLEFETSTEALQAYRIIVGLEE